MDIKELKNHIEQQECTDAECHYLLGCSYGQADGPDDYCNECNCEEILHEIENNILKEDL